MVENMPSGRKGLRGAYAVILLIALPWIFYFPAWLRPMAQGDNLVEMWPTARFVFGELGRGRDPLWNPYLCSGFPVAGYANTGMYSITNLLNLILPHVWALTFQIMLIHSLAGIGLYLFVRRLGASMEGALLGGVIFSFCGFLLWGFPFSYFMAAAVGIGFVFWALEGMRTSDSVVSLARMTLLGGLLLALQLLASHPQLTVISGLLYSLYVIWFTFAGLGGKRGLRLAASGAAMLILAVGLTAAMWMPALELLRHSYRENIPWERFVGLSVSPWEMFSSLFLLRRTEYMEYAFWLGIPAALLAWRGLRNEWDKPIVKMLMTSVFIAALLGFGKYTPFYRLLFHIPVFNRLTAPARYALDFCFALSCLAALGWDSLRRNSLGLLHSRREMMIFILVILAAIAVVKWDNANAIVRIIPDILVGSAAIALTTRWARGDAPGRYAHFIFIFLVIIPAWLTWGGPRVVEYDPRPQRVQHWKTVEDIISGKPPARILDFVDLRDLDSETVRRLPAHNLNVNIGWSDAAGYQPLMLERYSRLFEMDFTGIIGHPQRLFDVADRALDLLNVRCILIPADYMKSKESHLRIVNDRKSFKGVAFGENIGLTVNYSTNSGFRAPEFIGSVDGLAITSSMGYSTDIPQGKEVAEIALRGENNESRTLKLRAGIETAEMMHTREEDMSPSKTVNGVPFYRPVNAPLGAELEQRFGFRERYVSSITLLTYLYNAESIPQNMPVARVQVVGDNGKGREFLLRAGVDTAQWTAGSSIVRIAHKPAKQAETFEAGGVVGHTFIASNRLEPLVRSSSIKVKCLLTDKTSGIYLSDITLQNESGAFVPLSGVTAHDRPLSLPTPAGKGFTYFAKWEFSPITPKWIGLNWLISEQSKTSLSLTAMTFLKYGETWPVHPVDVVLGNPERFDLLYKDDLAVVIKNKSALPRAWLAGETIALAPEKILEAVTTGKLPDGSGFDPLRTALIEKPLPFSWTSLAGAAPIEPAVEIEEYSANRIRLKVAASRPGMLVLSEIYYPGWETEVDGRPAETLQVDYVLRGVPMQPGRHEVMMRFRPATVRRGRIVSLVSLVFVFGALFGIGIYGGIPKKLQYKEEGITG